MHLTLPRASFAKALEFAARVAARRSTVPILSHIRLAAGAGRLILACTDMDIEAQTALDADVKNPGATTVPAATLHDIIRKLAGDQVSLELKDSRLTVKSGRAKFHLATLPVEDWPSMDRGDMSHKFILMAEGLARAIKKTAFAISTEETRYYLNGVFFHATASELRLVATDAHRLSRVTSPLPPGAENMPAVIVPRQACAELLRLAETALKDDKAGLPTVEVELSAQKIAFRSGDNILLSKLINGTFPDYERVIPSHNDHVAIVSRAETTDAADRVATVISERGRAVKLTFDAGKLILSVVNPDTGDAAEDVEADYDGPTIEIGFNSKYLTEALNALDGDEVRIELNDAGSPTILRSAPDADLLVVLMPMRV